MIMKNVTNKIIVVIVIITIIIIMIKCLPYDAYSVYLKAAVIECIMTCIVYI